MKWNNIKEIQPKKLEIVLVKMKSGTITGAWYMDNSQYYINKGFYPIRIKHTKQYKNSCECTSENIPPEFDEKPKLWAAIKADWIS